MRSPAQQHSRRRSQATDSDLAELLLLAGNGDVGAFMRFYDATIRAVYRYARLRYDDASTADEVVRSVYARAWSSAARYPGSGLSAMAWLLATPAAGRPEQSVEKHVEARAS